MVWYLENHRYNFAFTFTYFAFNFTFVYKTKGSPIIPFGRLILSLQHIS